MKELARGKFGPNTPCFFDQEDLNRFLSFSEGPRDRRGGSVVKKYLDLRPFMDECPMQVPPNIITNVVFDMFKKLGLRYILVVNKGELMGIITKKDILQHIHIMKHNKKRKFKTSAKRVL